MGFVYVVCPPRALAEASRQTALELAANGPRAWVGRCLGCGAGFASEPTRGCQHCSWREQARRKRQRGREARQHDAA